MPVPDYQTLMAPTLSALGDGQPKSTVALRNIVAERLGLSEADRKETIKSGSPVFDSRVHWALTYMSQAGLVSRPKRGIAEITERGRQFLGEHPDRIDNHLLGEFPEFKEFKTRARAAAPVSPIASPAGEGTLTASGVTPQETIYTAVEEINAAVAAELLVRIRSNIPTFLSGSCCKYSRRWATAALRGRQNNLGAPATRASMASFAKTPSDSIGSTSRRNGMPPTGRLGDQTFRDS